MTLKEVEDTARKIKEEDEIQTRNSDLDSDLAHDIHEIQNIYNETTSDGFPVRLQTGKTDDGRFLFVIVPCKNYYAPTVDIDITLGVHSSLGHNLGDEALLVIETFRAQHKAGDKPYERSVFVLGKDYVKKPVGTAGLMPHQTSNADFNDEYGSVGQALDIVQKEVRSLALTSS